MFFFILINVLSRYRCSHLLRMRGNEDDVCSHFCYKFIPTFLLADRFCSCLLCMRVTDVLISYACVGVETMFVLIGYKCIPNFLLADCFCSCLLRMRVTDVLLCYACVGVKTMFVLSSFISPRMARCAGTAKWL